MRKKPPKWTRNQRLLLASIVVAAGVGVGGLVIRSCKQASQTQVVDQDIGQVRDDAVVIGQAETVTIFQQYGPSARAEFNELNENVVRLTEVLERARVPMHMGAVDLATSLTPVERSAYEGLTSKYRQLEQEKDRLEKKYKQKLALTLEAQLRHATVLIRLGRYGEAEIACRTIAQGYPENAVVYNNWGCALLGRALEERLPDSEQLFHAAILRFEKSVALEPGSHVDYYNWGMALSELARSTPDG